MFFCMLYICKYNLGEHIMDSQIFAFILMPFDKKFDDIYNLGIKSAAVEANILAERVDEQFYEENMLDRIYNQIELSDFIVADMTDKNPNVFYEVGYAHAKGKICILLTQKADDIPFDLKHHRHIVYGDSISHLKKQLKKEIDWIKEQLIEKNKNIVSVSLANCDGFLELTKYYATAKVDFKFDLHNQSSDRHKEIDAIYFYCGDGWVLSQAGKTSSSTVSDLTDFKKRHFLEPPVKRLNKQSWAQLEFSADKIMARLLIGEKAKDSYRLTGRSLIRLVAIDGNYDYEIPLDVTVDDVPF